MTSPSDDDRLRALIRDGLATGLSPDQIYAANGKRRAVYLAALEEEAMRVGEFDAFEPSPEVVADLRERDGYRWERIAVRVFGDPRRTTDVRDLYDQAKGEPGASRRSWTGRGRRFRGMD
jgi:hypothetical protein